MVVVDRLENCPKLARAHFLHRCESAGQSVCVRINLPVKALSLFVQHFIIGIKKRVKGKPVARLPRPQTAFQRLCGLIVNLLRLALNLLITVSPRYLFRHHKLRLVGGYVFRADIFRKPFLSGIACKTPVLPRHVPASPVRFARKYALGKSRCVKISISCRAVSGISRSASRFPGIAFRPSGSVPCVFRVLFDFSRSAHRPRYFVSVRIKKLRNFFRKLRIVGADKHQNHKPDNQSK